MFPVPLPLHSQNLSKSPHCMPNVAALKLYAGPRLVQYTHCEKKYFFKTEPPVSHHVICVSSHDTSTYQTSNS